MTFGAAATIVYNSTPFTPANSVKIVLERSPGSVVAGCSAWVSYCVQYDNE